MSFRLSRVARRTLLAFTLGVAVVSGTLAEPAVSASPAQAKCKLRSVGWVETIPYAGKGPNAAFPIYFNRVRDCVGTTVVSTLYMRPCTGDAQKNSKLCRDRGAPIKVKTASYTITAGDLTAGRDSRYCLPADPRADVTPGTPICIWSVDQCTVESRKPWFVWWGTVTVSGDRKGLTTRRWLRPITAGNLSC